jgi:hypothetical protein
MKLQICLLLQLVVLQLFFLDAVCGLGTPLPCAAAFLNRKRRFVTKTRPVSSTAKSILGFTTVSQFEKEEDEAECKIWIDAESDECIDDGIDEDVFDDDDDEFDDDEFDDEQLNENGVNHKKSESIQGSSLTEPQGQEIEEHPMRTDEWLIKVKLSPFIILPRTIKREGALFPKTYNGGNSSKITRRKEQVMKFSKNGYVILMESGENRKSLPTNNKQRITNVGKWQMDATGISWTIQADLLNKDKKHNHGDQDFDSKKRTYLHYHADIHLSKFQSKPRMFRGTVTRDRFENVTSEGTNKGFFGKSFFRPVIASFSAEGIGEDTLVLQYKDRGFGVGTNGK